jgi:hypothetical protein
MKDLDLKVSLIACQIGNGCESSPSSDFSFSFIDPKTIRIRATTPMEMKISDILLLLSVVEVSTKLGDIEAIPTGIILSNKAINIILVRSFVLVV